MTQDLRYALRMLVRQPGFSIVAIVTLALGIGANTAIFSLLDKVIVRPLPVEMPERLITFEAGGAPLVVSNPFYETLRDRAAGLSSLAAHAERPFTLGGGTHGERVTGAIVSGNYFRTIGVTAAVGRLFGEEEDHAAGSHAVAAISHGLWRRAFASDPRVIGRTITINARSLMVVGVLPSGFSGTTRGVSVDVYMPRMMAPVVLPDSEEALTATNWGWLRITGRLAPGATMAQAQAALDPVFEELGFGRKSPVRQSKESFNLGPLPSVRLRHGGRGYTEGIDNLELPLKMVMGAVGLVLLIACANVASLLLARAVARRREIGIRIATGAGRGRIVRQLLTEGLLLSSIGGAIGSFVAAKLAALLVGFQQQVTYIPQTLDATIDARALAFTVVLSLLTGLAFGLAPARHSLTDDVLPALKGDISAAPRRSAWRTGGVLIIGQTALSIVVLVVALLCIKSLRAIQAIDTGIDTTKVMTAAFDLGLNRYDDDRGRQFIATLQHRVGAQPGVESVAFGTIVAFSDSVWVSGARPEGYQPAAGERLAFDFNAISPGYFRTLGTPLAAGREFTDADGLGATPVAIVNEALVRRFWPGQNAIGKRLDRGRRVVEIVGVVRDTRARKITEEPRPTIFLPLAQLYSSNVTLHVRSATESRGVLQAVRTEIQTLDPGLAVSNLQTLEAQRNGSLYAERLSAALLGILGLMAVTLVAIGLYGIMSYSVTQRTREIGVRSALGAQPRDLLRLVVGRGLGLTAAGIALGTAGSLAVVRIIRGVLFEVSPLDGPTFVIAPLGLLTVALAACWLPARRAARLNPLAALRHE